MIRRLTPGDFNAVWELGKPMINERLKPDRERARCSYNTLLSQSGVIAECAFCGDLMTGAVIASSHENAFAKKSFANVDLWLGPVALLDRVVAWWEGRPLLRVLIIQFPNDVVPSMYRMLRMKGFDRSGDMNMYWR